jgi:hypothetical protein
LPAPEKPTIFIFGHFNHSTEIFINMLKATMIDVVAGVHLVPYHPQYREDEWSTSLKIEGIAFAFLGKVPRLRRRVILG